MEHMGDGLWDVCWWFVEFVCSSQLFVFLGEAESTTNQKNNFPSILELPCFSCNKCISSESPRGWPPAISFNIFNQYMSRCREIFVRDVPGRFLWWRSWRPLLCPCSRISVVRSREQLKNGRWAIRDGATQGRHCIYGQHIHMKSYEYNLFNYNIPSGKLIDPWKLVLFHSFLFTFTRGYSIKSYPMIRKDLAMVLDMNKGFLRVMI